MSNQVKEFWSMGVSLVFAMGLVGGFLYFAFGTSVSTVISEPPERSQVGPRPATFTSAPPAESDSSAAPPAEITFTRPTVPPRSDSKAAVYRWVDESGSVQFGDRPPAGVEQLSTVEVSPNVVEFHTPDMPPSTPARPQPVPSQTITTRTVVVQDTSSKCKYYKTQLKYLRARMRQGYAPSESNRLHDEERRLKEMISNYC